MGAPSFYRSLLRLYPREFRADYGDDLVQSFTDLSDERGHRCAWRRVALDLVVTVPRYRLETIMNERHRTTVLTGTIVAMACAGIVSVLVGLYVGVVLLPLAAVVAITQRSHLARSMDVVDGDRLRRKRLRVAAILAGLLPVIYFVSLPILGDSWGADAVVAFAIWTAVLIAAVCYFIAGITTPRARVAPR